MWIGKCFTTYCRFQTLNGLRTIAELETQRVKITILWMERVSIVSTMPTHTHTLLTHQYSIKHILTLHNFESMYIRLTHLWFGPPSPGHGAHISSVFGPSSSVKQTLHQIHTYHNHVQLPTGGDSDINTWQSNPHTDILWCLLYHSVSALKKLH